LASHLVCYEKKSGVYNTMYATAPAPNTSALNHAMSRRVAPPVAAGDDELAAGDEPPFEEVPEAVDLQRILRNYKENDVL
jgi:hypothetical protein